MKGWLRMDCLAFTMVFLMGCQDDESLSAGQVDAGLIPFLESFEKEGQARNYEAVYATNLIDMRFDTLSGAVTGQCKTYSDGRREVVISAAFWAQATYYEREFLVFHELGHCILDRDHLETQTTNGTCTSIMHSGTGGCRNTYSPDTRRVFLDELFYFE